MKTDIGPLRRLFGAILDEAENNPAFAERLLTAFSESSPSSAESPARARLVGGRRPPGVLDPFTVYKDGADTLRAALGKLDIERLKDIVAEHGMDSAKVAAKWKDTERLVDLIVSTVSSRARKGEAFRAPAAGAATDAPAGERAASGHDADMALVASQLKALERRGHDVNREAYAWTQSTDPAAASRILAGIRDLRYDDSLLADALRRLAPVLSAQASLLSTLEGLRNALREANLHADQWRKGQPPDASLVVRIASDDAKEIEREAVRAHHQLELLQRGARARS